jgi:hypothetical protein
VRAVRDEEWKRPTVGRFLHSMKSMGWVIRFHDLVTIEVG